MFSYQLQKIFNFFSPRISAASSFKWLIKVCNKLSDLCVAEKVVTVVVSRCDVMAALMRDTAHTLQHQQTSDPVTHTLFLHPTVQRTLAHVG